MLLLKKSPVNNEMTEGIKSNGKEIPAEKAQNLSLSFLCKKIDIIPPKVSIHKAKK